MKKIKEEKYCLHHEVKQPHDVMRWRDIKATI